MKRFTRNVFDVWYPLVDPIIFGVGVAIVAAVILSACYHVGAGETKYKADR